MRITTSFNCLLFSFYPINLAATNLPKIITVRKGAPHYLQNVRSKIHHTFTSNVNYNRQASNYGKRLNLCVFVILTFVFQLRITLSTWISYILFSEMKKYVDKFDVPLFSHHHNQHNAKTQTKTVVMVQLLYCHIFISVISKIIQASYLQFLWAKTTLRKN